MIAANEKLAGGTGSANGSSYTFVSTLGTAGTDSGTGELDLCAAYKETLFDFARYRRPEVYGRITGQRGPEVPDGVQAALAAAAEGGDR